MPGNVAGENGANRLLKGWKEIAGYLGKDESTVRRWASAADLPAHRVPGRKRAAVYAYASELDAWLRRAAPDRGPDAALPQLSVGHDDAPRPADASPTTAVLSRPRRTVSAGLAAALAAFLCVAGLLGLYLHRGGAPAGVHTPVAGAQDLYLQGVYQWEKRTPESLAKAAELFESAARLDPGYAAPHAGLANTYNLLREYGTMPAGEAYAEAAKAGRRAVELDPANADARSALAFAEFYGFRRLQEGIAHFEQARNLDPGSAKIRHWLANALLHLGRFSEALAEINEAQRLDPASPSILASKGLALFCAGQTEAAVALLTGLAHSEPDLSSPHAYLAFVYLAKGDHAAYLDALRTVGRMRGDFSRAAVADAGVRGLAATGFRGMIAEMIAEEHRQYDAGHSLRYNIARLEALAGNEKAAVDFLRASLSANEEHVMMLHVDPAFRLISANAEFRQLVVDVGLPVLR